SLSASRSANSRRNPDAASSAANALAPGIAGKFAGRFPTSWPVGYCACSFSLGESGHHHGGEELRGASGGGGDVSRARRGLREGRAALHDRLPHLPDWNRGARALEKSTRGASAKDHTSSWRRKQMGPAADAPLPHLSVIPPEARPRGAKGVRR